MFSPRVLVAAGDFNVKGFFFLRPWLDCHSNDRYTEFNISMQCLRENKVKVRPSHPRIARNPHTEASTVSTSWAEKKMKWLEDNWIPSKRRFLFSQTIACWTTCCFSKSFTNWFDESVRMLSARLGFLIIYDYISDRTDVRWYVTVSKVSQSTCMRATG